MARLAPSRGRGGSGAGQLDLKEQRWIRREGGGRAAAAGPRRGPGLERIVAVLARVELRSLGAALVEPAGVVDADGAARFGALAAADDGVVDLEAGGSGVHARFPVMARSRRAPPRGSCPRHV